ncbi:hypothetical protein WUBG_00682 [Wuchereria bancrofti]|uniref:Uncharacterized protein n=1 Tax=Wuchereria bancrofti TaxID=6293 RepID=J9BLK0_WUCBA|nr:hypothetical protein WUBG_00682 [Wuchereria bancrofti]
MRKCRRYSEADCQLLQCTVDQHILSLFTLQQTITLPSKLNMSKLKVAGSEETIDQSYRSFPSQSQTLPVPILKTLHRRIPVPTLNNATSYIPVRCGTLQIAATATNQKVDLPLLL